MKTEILRQMPVAIALVAITLLLSFIPVASAQGEMVDQSCLQQDDSRNILGMEHIGQEFKPCLNPLDGVEVYLIATGAGNDDITVNIRENDIIGPIIATVTETINAPFDGFYYFDLGGAVPVIPDSTYVIELNLWRQYRVGS